MFEDRYYQVNAVNSIFDYYDVEHKRGNPLVAMPTGTGKSVVIARFIQRALQRYPRTRFMMATHVKELVEQNANKIIDLFPGAPLGIYSAGLKQRHTTQPIIYGGVASMVKNPVMFGHRDLLLVDEAHLISGADSSQYDLLIRGLKSTNPALKVIGFTATKYRMGQGLLTNGGIFTDICYDDTTLERFNQLLAEGYLSMLVPQPTDVEIDMRGVKTNNGEFVQAEAEQRAMRITRQAIDYAARFKHSRHSWLVFASGLENAYQACAYLNEIGITATVVHSNNKQYPMSDKERDDRIADFKAGKYQAIVNYGILTTGFDHPPIDLILMLRATKSVPLWVQMLGRGTRPFFGSFLFPPKNNCLVLDFARNTERLGPINDPIIPAKKGAGGGDAPIKICESCGTYNHISARFCIGCGEEFQFADKLTKEASTEAVVRDAEPIIERFKVRAVNYRRHSSKQSNLDTFCAMYSVEEQTLPISQYVHIEAQGKAREHAVNWWATRSGSECPQTITEALQMTSYLRPPSYIHVVTNAKYPSIERFEYDT